MHCPSACSIIHFNFNTSIIICLEYLWCFRQDCIRSQSHWSSGSMHECGVRDPKFESHRRQIF